MNRRRGASLIELMVVIAIATSIIGMVGTLFHRLFLSERIATRTALMEQVTSRLADQFRRDIHAAQSVQRIKFPEKELPAMELTISEAGRIVYSGGKNLVQRDVIGGDGVKAHETYRLPECRVTFQEPDPSTAGDSAGDSGIASRMVKLMIERPHSTVTSSVQAPLPLRMLLVEAELGRDLRLSNGKVLPATPESSEEAK